MPRHTHFGRRIRLPSKIGIKHDLMLMATADALVHSLNNQNCSPVELSEIMDEMRKSYNFPPQVEQMIMSRLEHKS